jgi:putative spermidine/putrescine transport system substrate-binding protein
LAYYGGSHSFSLAALSLGIQTPFHLDPSELRQAVERLVALRRNVRAFYTSPEESVELFRTSRVALMLANYGPQQLTLLQKAGLDVGYVIPREGTLAWLDCWAVSRGARNRRLAEQWIDYTLEAPVSGALSTRQGLANTLQEPQHFAAGARLIWLEPVEDAARRTALWRRIIAGDLPERF